jgi:hypothetical protein
MARRLARVSWVFVFLVLVALGAEAQDGGNNRGFLTVQEILVRSCAMCHGEVDSHQAIIASGWVVAGSPEESPLFQAVASDSMPPGEALPVTEKNLLRAWIAAGAEASDTPIVVTLPGEEGTGMPPAQGATPEGSGAAGASKSFLGFSSKTRFHQVSGFTSGSLLLAAGVVGAVQFGTLIAEGHAYREANGIEEDEISSVCSAYIMDLWANPMHTALRWTHVGLLISGETLYLANAATGLSMLTRDRPGLTPQDVHRYAFFTHGALMVAEVVMGFLTTSVLANGSHEQIRALGIAHSAIGLAIPLVVITSGVLINREMK